MKRTHKAFGLSMRTALTCAALMALSQSLYNSEVLAQSSARGSSDASAAGSAGASGATSGEELFTAPAKHPRISTGSSASARAASSSSSETFIIVPRTPLGMSQAAHESVLNSEMRRLRSQMAKGGDFGGANGLQGRPLESFADRVVSETAEYRELIAPALANLKQKVPALATDLQAIAENKVWFFVPVSLKTLPPWVIGTAFFTEQLALQSQVSVWIDSRIYDNNSVYDSVKHREETVAERKRDRAIVILHEMMMGLRLAQLNAAWYCSSDSGPVSCARALSDGDYDQIRRFTLMVLDKSATLDAEKLKQDLFENGFGDYLQAPAVSKKLTYVPTLETLSLIFNAEKRKGRLPTRDSLSQYGCAYDVSFDQAAQKFSVDVYDAVNRYGISVHHPEPFTISGPLVTKIDEDSTLIDVAQDVNSPKPGDYRRSLHMALTTDGIVSVVLQWEMYDFDTASGLMQWGRVSRNPSLPYGQSKSCAQ
jgi:hypothetical protein